MTDEPWNAYRGKVPESALDYWRSESTARKIRHFQPLIVPGLLQTPEYRRALLLGLGYGDYLEALMEIHAHRVKSALREGGPLVHYIFDDAALTRWVGGESTMAEQVEHIQGLLHLPNLTVQVIRYDQGAYPGMLGEFTILTHERDTLIREDYLETRYITEDREVEAFAGVFAGLAELAAQESL